MAAFCGYHSHPRHQHARQAPMTWLVSRALLNVYPPPLQKQTPIRCGRRAFMKGSAIDLTSLIGVSSGQEGIDRVKR
jgi:hypothetical protein